ncbi:glycosyltransferase family 4 protein [Fontisphaera persica]|uniref:glycosyltransferase family 4 protein n=1 Tax=Fontisphaera persica TaxID=2974023 RepID=UPI0024C02CF7|nr:glycosyltransferase family 4 protein [Fontisphaera persica]WCJ59711.1 glycosyltransferase family 4 protein [Fontisphaera persica]
MSSKVMSGKLTIAIIFRRFGPYHIARLAAASKYFNIAAVEYAVDDKTYDWERVDDCKGITCYYVTTDLPKGMHKKYFASRRLSKLLSDIKPAACALPGWAMEESLMGLIWCRSRNIPAILMSESTAIDYHRTWWKEWIKKQIARQFSAALVGGTPHAEYAQKLGIPHDKIFFGYDAIDNEYFKAEAVTIRKIKDEYRRRYSLPENYFLASARFIEKKNLIRLIDAYAGYHRLQNDEKKQERSPNITENSHWHLVVLGDGPMRTELLEKTRQHGLDRYVIFPGFRQYRDLPAYYALANAFIHASTSEQWGLVVNEAMACGLPVLVSNRCGCARDLVDEGKNGLLFDPYKTEEITQCMQYIASLDNNLRAEMGAASLTLIDKWGVDRFADGLKDAVECARNILKA